MSYHHPIGFIGLGKMGAPMAINLAKSGYPLVIYDIIPSAIENVLRGAGGSPTVAGSPAEVAVRCRRIITMLPGTLEVQQVYQGDSGLLSSVYHSSLLIDCSTTDPVVAHDIDFEARKKGASFVDAPAVGTVNDAEQKTLKFLVGGTKSDYFHAVEILSVFGKKLFHCGGPGMGQACKICSNMLVGITMIGLSEVMNLGSRLGVDPELLNKVINMSNGQCWSSEFYNPCPGIVADVPSSNDYEGGFATKLMSMDLQLAQEAARSSDSPIPIGSMATQIYQLMNLHGFGNLDFSSVYKYLSQPMRPPASSAGRVQRFIF